MNVVSTAQLTRQAEIVGGGARNRDFDHVVVVGSSIAGLTAARILADHFAQVTIIDRDRVPESPQIRRGAPQAHHAHSLPLRGQNILEWQFPGLFDELLANGAIAIDGGSEIAVFIAGRWHQVSHQAAVVSMTCSRPLLETTLYRRLANHPKVRLIQEHEVRGLSVDRRGERVTGVRLQRRHGPYHNEIHLPANLVVDASGRDSRAPHWLASLGYTPPRESVVNSYAGYASRLYRFPNGLAESWKILYIRPTPPDATRGGMILPIEGGRWQVTLVGVARDYPPTNEEEFLAFARSLPAPALYEAIKEGEPLSRVYGYRRSENRVRHYDRLPRYLEGFLVCGDAAYVLNPVYAQGMTAAVMGSQALDACLTAQRRRGDLTGLSRAFQLELSRAVADPWQLAVRADKRWPATDVIEEIIPIGHRAPGRVDPVPAAANLAAPLGAGRW